MTIRPRLLCLFAFLLNSATGVLVVAQPLLAIRFGAGPLLLGLLGSAGALVYAAACPFAGRLSDELAAAGPPAAGRRRALILSAGLFIVVDLSILLVRGIRDVFILSACGSVCAALFWPTVQAWIAEAGRREGLSGRLGVFNLSWSLGIMAGPIAGGFLFVADYRFPWLYGLAVNAVILAVLLATRPGPAGGDAPPVPAESPPAPVPAAFFRLALWANFVCWFSLANAQSIYPKLALARGFSPQSIGVLLFLVGAAQSLFFFVLMRHSFWQFRYWPLVAVHAAAAAGMAVIACSGSAALLAVAFPLLGLGLGLSYYSSIYYSVCGLAAAGRRTGIHEFIVGSGFLMGPIIGGTIAHLAGLRAPFAACALLLAGTAAAEAAIGGRSERGGSARG
ncbi:MAG: MFS transporter [bacterium]|nr:MFS transporter [bacterium]